MFLILTKILKHESIKEAKHQVGFQIAGEGNFACQVEFFAAFEHLIYTLPFHFFFPLHSDLNSINQVPQSGSMIPWIMVTMFSMANSVRITPPTPAALL